MKLKLIQGAKTTSQHGFSMIETMMAAMISLIFMSLGANLVLAANIHKIVAKRNIAMNYAIQSDLDGIKYQANLLAQKGIDPMNPTSPTQIDYCKSTTPESGIAGALKAKLGVATPVTMKIMDRNYLMTRTIGISTKNKKILTVDYKFNYGTVTTPEYELYTEVIPNAALSCSPT